MVHVALIVPFSFLFGGLNLGRDYALGWLEKNRQISSIAMIPLAFSWPVA
jgi:hypothetical protein